MFAAFLATLVQEGHVDTKHGLVIEPGNVLYLDWETDKYEIASRTRKIHKGLGIQRPSRIIYRYMGQPLLEDADRIRDIVHKHNIDMVVYDSMGLAIAGELESAEDVLAFFRSIRIIDKTALIISHSNRQGTIFGSAYSMNSARSVWEAKKSGANAGGIDFALFHRKANNVSQQSAQVWTVEFRPDEILYTRGDVYMTEAAGDLSYSDLVYRILQADGPKTKEYLADRIADMKSESNMDRVKRNVATAISKYKQRATVTEAADGNLALASKKNPEGDEDNPEGKWTL